MTGRPKIAMLSNPLSGHNRGPGRNTAIAELASREAFDLHETRSPTEIESALLELTEQPPDVLIVNGGDGTVRLVAGALRKATIFETEPILALLQGGSTNMIQKDVGLHGQPIHALRRLLDTVRYGVPQTCLRSRSPLRVQRQSDKFDEYGFFWSAGVLPRVLRLAQDGYANGRARGPAGEAAALLGVLKTLLFGDPAKHPHLSPEPIDWQSGAAASPAAPPGDAPSASANEKMFALLTTLDRLVLGFSPASGTSTDLKLLSLNYPYRRQDLLSFLLSRGRKISGSDSSFTRMHADEFVLQVSSNWVLDGEFFEHNESHGPLHISTAMPFRFISC
jgi:diacylglycerol kinase (ATP)